MPPDAPTSAPVTIISGLSSVKPMPQDAQPESEFRTEMTTGMSAPPIGNTTRRPQTRNSTVIAQNAPSPPQPAKASPAKIAVRPSSPLTARWPGKTSGEPVISPCSFAKATTEPVNVTAPMAEEIAVSIRDCSGRSPPDDMP